MGHIGWRLTPSTLSRLDRLGLLRDDGDIATAHACVAAQQEPPFPPYDLPPFDQNPIACPTDRKSGWIREFKGPLSVEYRTGFFYMGLRLVRNSWDGLYPPEYAGKTKPLRDWRTKHQRIDEGVVLTDVFLGNYYHFLTDFAAKVDLVERSGLPLSIPYVVGEHMSEMRFFARARELGLLGARPLVIHKRRHWLEAGRLFTVFPDRPEYFTARRLGARPDPRRRDRLYVSRGLSAPNGRQIRNEAELTQALDRRGFEIVDPAQWSLKQQIERFSAASLVVGPHGSGLTNIMFRSGAPLALVEIIPDNKVWRHHFYEMSQRLNFFYRAILGCSPTASNETAAFEVDTKLALEAIDQALAWEAEQYGMQATSQT
jgi:hypothetical protein